MVQIQLQVSDEMEKIQGTPADDNKSLTTQSSSIRQIAEFNSILFTASPF